MRVEKSPQGVENDFVQTAEPAGIDQRLHFREKARGHLGLEGRGLGLRGHARILGDRSEGVKNTRNPQFVGSDEKYWNRQVLIAQARAW